MLGRLLLVLAAVLGNDDPPPPTCDDPVTCALGAVAARGIDQLTGTLGERGRDVACRVLPGFLQDAAGNCPKPWDPKKDDFVIVVKNTLHKEHVGRSGQIIKMGSAQIKKKGHALVEYESKGTEWYRYPKSWLRKMTSEEETDYLKKYPEKAPRPPDASTQPPRPTLAPATPQEMETCGKKVFHFINMTGFAPNSPSTLFKTAEQSPYREMIEPEIYNEKALVKFVSVTDEMLVFATPGRERRADTKVEAIGGVKHAIKVSGAELVELLCGEKGLYEEAQKLPPGKKCENCLRSEEAKRRIAEAEALADEAAAQKQLASEPQVEIDIYVVRGGHETGLWTTDGLIEKKSSKGDVGCTFSPGRCVPARKAYEGVLCGKIEAAFLKSAGGVVPAAEKLVPVFFEQENVRRFARRGYLTNGVTGRALAATRCRAGTKSCDQMGP